VYVCAHIMCSGIMVKNIDTLVNTEYGKGLSFNFYNLGSLAY